MPETLVERAIGLDVFRRVGILARYGIESVAGHDPKFARRGPYMGIDAVKMLFFRMLVLLRIVSRLGMRMIVRARSLHQIDPATEVYEPLFVFYAR